MYKRSNISLLVGLLLVVIQPLNAQVAPDLFAAPSKAGGPAQAAMQVADAELPAQFRLVRSRLVRVDLSAINPANENRPPRLRLNFFSDSAFEAAELIARPRANGEGFEWYGSLDDGMPAQAVLSVVDGRVSGSLGTTQAHYQIRHLEGDLHVIQEVLVDEPATEDALVPDLSRGRVSASPLLEKQIDGPPTVNGAGNTVLDVLVCYTTDTRVNRGGSQAVRDRIQLAVAEANAGFINSEMAIEFNLVGMVEIDGDGGSGLPERPTSAYIQDVTYNRSDIHALRDYYGADLVSVWVNETNGGTVGIGWVFQGGSFSEFTYSIVSTGFATGPSYTFSHEAGHNLGCAHNRENASVDGRYDYSYGYRKKDVEPKFYTIMSYSSGCGGCAPVNQWSNPSVDVDRNGATAPSGVEAGQSDSADNALTLANTGPVQSAYRAPTNPPANNNPEPASQVVEVTENSSVVITLFAFDPDSDPLVYTISSLPADGALVGSGASWTYTPDPDYVGSDSFDFHVHDNRGGFGSATVSIVVNADTGGGGPTITPPLAEGLNVPAATDQWQTVGLSNTYASPVIVCTPEYGAGSPPLITRLRNVGSASFELRMGRFDGSAAAVPPTPARCLIVEEGVYTVGANGISAEAVKFSSNVTAHDGSWAGHARSYNNTYSSPVVVGQVMSTNDASPSNFWARGPNVSTPPTSTTLVVGKTVNEDPNTTRADETVGYIVMEAGVATAGGLTLEAGVKTGVAGFNDAPPYVVNLTTTPTGAVLSSATMAGFNGGWPVLFAPNAVSGQQLRTAFDEDQLQDAERNHIAERVAYLAWTSASGANQDPTANPQSLSTAYQTPLAIVLTGTDPDFDPLTFGIDTQPANGSLSGTAPNVTYTPNALYTGPDSFTFSVNDGRGGVDQAVVSIAVGGANQTPTADPQSLNTAYQTALPITLTGSDPDLDSLTFAIDVQPTNGMLSGVAPNVTYTPDALYSGPDSFTFSVNDNRGGVDQAVVSITVGSAPTVTPPLAEGINVAAATGQWQTVSLANTYISPVVVCTPEYGAGSPPATARLRNVGSTSFEMQLARFDGSTAALTPTTTRCFVVEEGVYTTAANGMKLEAVRFTSTLTDHATSWAGQARTYANAYASPVVVGQVMSANDANPSAFWARGLYVSSPPSASHLYVGKNVGKDPNKVRANETVGYIVMEAGVTAIGSLTVETGVNTGVAGYGNAPPYTATLATTPSGAVLSGATMLGAHGGWPILYGPGAVAGQQLRMAWEEDTVASNERGHFPERVAYLAWTSASGANQDPTANPQSLSTAYQTPLAIALTGTDPDFDALTFAIDVQPTNGTLSGVAPNVTYTPDALYSGPDSFTFSVNDNRGGVDQAVVSITVGSAPTVTPPLAEGINVAAATGQWQTVSLANTYISPVVVCTPEYGAGSPPTTARLRNVGSTSFEMQLARFDGSTAALTPTTTRCFVVEQGVYTTAANGMKLEAVQFTSTVTDHATSWAGQARTYANAYASPVVVGQVMSANDANPSAFWARGLYVSSPPSASHLYVGKNVGKDPNKVRANETVGYIVMEAGVTAIGSLTVETGVNTGVAGYGNAPPYTATLATTPSGAVLSGATMLGAHGGWPILYGPGAVAGQQLRMAWEEDTVASNERGHFPERVAYLAWTAPPGANQSPTAHAQTVNAAFETALPIALTASDPDLDPVAFAIVTPPADGSLSGTAPNVLYMPNEGFSGPDSFMFSVEDGHGGWSQAQVSIIVAAAPNQAPVAHPQTLTTPAATPLPITLTGADADLDPLTFAVAAPPTNGTLSGTAPTVTYTPNGLYAGPDSFMFSVADGRGGVNQATVAITVVSGENNAPVAESQTLVTNHGAALSFNVSALDLDNDNLNFTIVDQTSHGVLSGTAPDLVYTPEAGFHGRDALEFSVSDGRGGSDTATVWISVRRAVNQQQIVISTAAELQTALLNAAPGEEYLLAPGVYSRPGAQVFSTSDLGLLGSADHPIIFRAQNPANAPRVTALLLLQSPQYVQFKNIRFVNPPNNVHNINIYPVTGVAGTDVTFDSCEFRGLPGATLRSNIKATRIDNLYVRNTAFLGWGDSSIASVGLWNGIIENNRFLGLGANRQRIGLQLKGDTRDVVVRNNYFENAGDRVIQAGGSTGAQFFRAPAEFEATNIEIYGNRIVGGDACFSMSTQNQSSFHHNTCYLPEVWVGRLLQESQVMLLNQNGRIEHNLFVYTGGLNAEFINRSFSGLYDTFVFNHNAFYQVDGNNPSFPKLPTPDVNMVDQVDPELIDAGTRHMRIGSSNPLFNGIGADAVNPAP